MEAKYHILYKDKKTNEWLPERKIIHENLLNDMSKNT